MKLLLFICGAVMVGLAYELDSDFRVILFVEGMIIINHALLNERGKKSISFQ